MLSHGVPMLLYGDEVGRSQQGNNNAYCQDNELTWMNWSRTRSQCDLFRFFKYLIAFRRRHPALRREQFENSSMGRQLHINWHGDRLSHPDFSSDSRSIALHLHWVAPPSTSDHVFIIANSYWEVLRFELPKLEGMVWSRFLDTSYESPKEICCSRPGTADRESGILHGGSSFGRRSRCKSKGQGPHQMRILPTRLCAHVNSCCLAV